MAKTPKKEDGRKNNGGAREGAGRPETELTEEQWKTVKGLCAIMCTIEEIAGVLGMHRETLAKCIMDVHGQKFSEFFEAHSAQGKASIRRAQYEMATKGKSATMAIWLGKQYLDQKDKHEVGFDPSAPAVITLKMGKDLTAKAKENDQ